MTKMVKLSLAAAVLATGVAASDYSVSGDATFTSNALWRGASASGNTPTVQATLNVEHKSGVYAGMWATGLETGSEIDLYAGYATEVAGFGIDAGFVAYTTTNPAGESWTVDDCGELYVGVSKAVASIDLGATLYQEVLADETDTTFEASAGKDFEVAYVNATGGYVLRDNDKKDDIKYYSLTVGKSFESIKGDLSVTMTSKSSEIDDAVYAVAYTTSF